MIIPKYYENLEVLHENTMPARAYYIPASRRMDDLDEHREHSDRIQFLNGTWSFRYYKSIYELSDEFYDTDYVPEEYDELSVPHTWQMDGYDQQQYTNIRYPFPFDPPYVPQDIPCGCYIRDFEYTKTPGTDKVFLNFEGVDSCYYVWLNGTYVGYSQVPHATGEYDVTDTIKEGSNKLAVLVLKWCDGSYLEDQDKFRMSGIFREVYLLSRPEKAVRDYRITTTLSESETANTGATNTETTHTGATVSVDVEFYKPAIAEITIETAEGDVIDSASISDNGTITLSVETPVLWNTENPYLYTLIIKIENEVIVDRVGFRTVEIKDSVLYVNGRNIKFRGVNRHESDPVTGPVVSLEQIMTDLRLMKEYNFNAIRTSHYPDVPYFYQLCDKYGFMVVDEADIESHGPFMIYRKEDTEDNRFNRWNEKIADDPMWEESILDRVKLMAMRDKNRPCIVMWSMGNENAYGCNFEKALEWTKSFDSSRVTQYESAVHSNPDKTYNFDNLDINSQMYPSPDDIRAYVKDNPNKPFMMVEYCHSMGNGPGDFEDYFQLYHESDIYCGGFIWEWCDHAIYKGKSADGKDMYYYGGDHGEVLHDGNFCMDGLMYPDRRPHTAVMEYKNVYRPARVVNFDVKTKELILHNYMDYDDLCDYADVYYEVSCDGHVIEEGMVDIKPTAPHKNSSAILDFEVPAAGRVYLKIKYTLKKKIALLEEGFALGFDEVLIENHSSVNLDAIGIINSVHRDENTGIRADATDSEVNITGTNFAYIFDRKTGLFKSLSSDGRHFLDRPMEINIFRAPTDNDVYIKEEWFKAGYDRAYLKAYSSSISQDEKSVTITVSAAVVADGVQKILHLAIIWVVDTDGRITASMTAKKDPEFPDLPRFGIRMFLNKEFDKVTYFGLGPNESYRDKRRSSSHGIFTADISEMHEDYVRPQENGSHDDCDYVSLSDKTSGHSLSVLSAKTFAFNASVYSQEELMNKAHNFELSNFGSSILCIDYKQNGIGSNSCGPEVYEQYRFKEDEFEFAFVIIPN